jgi:ABC-type lipoprotein export system ATPase subunit
MARALVHEPALVLADEPTGALDEKNTELMIGLLFQTVKQLGATVVVTSHDPLVAFRADRVLRLHEGRLTPAESINVPDPFRP